jgi:hypothetical protein
MNCDLKIKHLKKNISGTIRLAKYLGLNVLDIETSLIPYMVHWRLYGKKKRARLSGSG